MNPVIPSSRSFQGVKIYSVVSKGEQVENFAKLPSAKWVFSLFTIALLVFVSVFSRERKLERKLKTQNPNHRQAEVQQLMQPETGCVSSNCRIGGGNGTNSDLVKHKYTVSHSRL